MRRERIERKPAKKPDRHLEVLSLDPRDPDVVRAKEIPGADPPPLKAA